MVSTTSHAIKPPHIPFEKNHALLTHARPCTTIFPTPRTSSPQRPEHGQASAAVRCSPILRLRRQPILLLLRLRRRRRPPILSIRGRPPPAANYSPSPYCPGHPNRRHPRADVLPYLEPRGVRQLSKEESESGSTCFWTSLLESSIESISPWSNSAALLDSIYPLRRPTTPPTIYMLCSILQQVDYCLRQGIIV
ncbi:uncharacterized protein [Triticum aestivum]|uniref:uncharacterized protein n=1 Tax=Triticum aestivum TaxID=4565 RepID=UPI001D025529|nr:uncharacterized protein LOC123115205 [Triticum aestivum]